jgi:hypothetical protein
MQIVLTVGVNRSQRALARTLAPESQGNRWSYGRARAVAVTVMLLPPHETQLSCGAAALLECAEPK